MAYDIPSLQNTLSDHLLKRKSTEEYRKMNKKTLFSSMLAFITNFDKLRYSQVGLKLENNFLQRRVEMLEARIKDLESLLGEHRSFKHYSKRDYPKNKKMKQ